MSIEKDIRDEKIQYETNREAAKISALSSGKTDTLLMNILLVKKYCHLINSK